MGEPDITLIIVQVRIMIFSVHKKGQSPQLYRNQFYLYEDRWNDWFEYVTMFSAVYIDMEGNELILGSVKIGMKDIIADHTNTRTRNFETIDFLPVQFETLPSTFFSLGQSDTYYEKIKSLGDRIRNEILVGLNDISHNEEIFENVKDLNIEIGS